MPLTVRPATIEDAEAIARVHVASWRTTYSGLVPQSFLDALDVDFYAARWGERIASAECEVLVAGDAGQVFGFICGGGLREPLGAIDAEVYAIYLLQTAQRQGVGRLLMQRMAQLLAGRGFRSLAVWVLTGNPARGFYEHLGGEFVAAKTIRIGDADLPEVALQWPAIERLANAP